MKRVKTDESIVRKWPPGLVLLKISAIEPRARRVERVAAGHPEGDGLVAGDLVHQVDAVVIRPSAAVAKSPFWSSGQGWLIVWTSIDRPSLSQAWSRGSVGLDLSWS